MRWWISYKNTLSYLKNSEHGIDEIVEIRSRLFVVVLIEHIHTCEVELAAEKLHTEKGKDDNEKTQEQ